MKVVIVTACDSMFFLSALDLVLSIRSTQENAVDIYVLDVGLTQRQIKTIGVLVNGVIPTRWDVTVPDGTAEWRRAMTARPFLPHYVNADVIVWIDSDAWVQHWFAVTDFVEAAADGALAIVEEQFGEGLPLPGDSAGGAAAARRVTKAGVFENLSKSLRESFGDSWAQSIGTISPFNSGAFALRSDSPYWGIWREWLRVGVSRSLNHFTEQNALNIAIRSGQIAVRKLPISHNYVCSNGLPDYCLKETCFVVPSTSARIGIMHLADAKSIATHAVRIIQQDRLMEMSLRYMHYLAYYVKRAG